MKNNIRLLTKEELNNFKEKYSFEIQGFFIVVKCNDFNRPTLHDIHHNFFLNHKGRKIIINSDTIKIWDRYYKDIHLVELQNLVNQLTIMYQDITPENIEKLLKKGSN